MLFLNSQASVNEKQPEHQSSVDELIAATTRINRQRSSGKRMDPSDPSDIYTFSELANMVS